MSQNKKGFTIIELIVVVAIITVLASILIPAGSTARNRARRAKAQSQIAALEVGITAFFTDFGFYPTSQVEGTSPNFSLSSGAQTETNNATIVEVLSGFSFSGGNRSPSTNQLVQSSTWSGPYIDIDESHVNSSAQMIDPWGVAYVFSLALDDDIDTAPSNNVYTFDIQSTGSGETIGNY